MSGSLVIVGTGIQLGQITLETKAHIELAEKVLYLVADPITENWIKQLNSNSESLSSFYKEGQNRLITYEAMVDHILSSVRNGKKVCAVFYGHPGIFVYPSHKAINIAKNEGFEARMLPGVSAEDCLFADLNVDPGKGCQSFEATDFLIRKATFDPSNILILWQIGVVGEAKYNPDCNLKGIPLLTELLTKYYSKSHNVVVYEASQYVVCQPVIQRINLGDLPKAKISGISTLFIPPQKSREINHEMKKQLEKCMFGEESSYRFKSLLNEDSP